MLGIFARRDGFTVAFLGFLQFQYQARVFLVIIVWKQHPAPVVQASLGACELLVQSTRFLLVFIGQLTLGDHRLLDFFYRRAQDIHGLTRRAPLLPAMFGLLLQIRKLVPQRHRCIVAAATAAGGRHDA